MTNLINHANQGLDTIAQSEIAVYLGRAATKIQRNLPSVHPVIKVGIFVLGMIFTLSFIVSREKKIKQLRLDLVNAEQKSSNADRIIKASSQKDIKINQGSKKEDLQKEISVLKAKLEVADETIVTQAKIISSLTMPKEDNASDEKIEPKTSDINQLESNLGTEDFQKEITELEMKLETALATIATQEKTIASLTAPKEENPSDKKIESLKRRIEKLKESNLNLTDQVSNQQKVLDKAETTIKAKDNSIQCLKDTFNQKHAMDKDKIEKLESENNALIKWQQFVRRMLANRGFEGLEEVDNL